MAPLTVALVSSDTIAIISLAISIIPIGAIALGALALAQHTVKPLLLRMRHEVGPHERRGWYPKNSRAPILFELRPAAGAAAGAGAGAGAAAGAGIGIGALISHALIRNQAVIRRGGGEVPVSLG